MKNLFFLLLISTFLSCGNDDEAVEQPPQISEENTFSCKIDGELFVAETFSRFPNTFPGIIAGVLSGTNNWTIMLRNSDNVIHIYITEVVDTGNYIIKFSDGDSFFFGETETVVEFGRDSSSSSTHHSIDGSGIININELVVNLKLIATFNEILLVSNDNPQETVILTEGKLNINLESLN